MAVAAAASALRLALWQHRLELPLLSWLLTKPGLLMQLLSSCWMVGCYSALGDQLAVQMR